MSKITAINRGNLNRIKGLIERANDTLNEVGLELVVGDGHFTKKNYSFKAEVRVQSEDGAEDITNTRIAVDFKRYARRYGLKPADLGRKFKDVSSGLTWANEVLQVLGAKPKNRKYPIIVGNTMGQTFKYPSAHIGQLLETSAVD